MYQAGNVIKCKDGYEVFIEAVDEKADSYDFYVCAPKVHKGFTEYVEYNEASLFTLKAVIKAHNTI